MKILPFLILNFICLLFTAPAFAFDESCNTTTRTPFHLYSCWAKKGRTLCVHADQVRWMNHSNHGLAFQLAQEKKLSPFKKTIGIQSGHLKSHRKMRPPFTGSTIKLDLSKKGLRLKSFTHAGIRAKRGHCSERKQLVRNPFERKDFLFTSSSQFFLLSETDNRSRKKAINFPDEGEQDPTDLSDSDTIEFLDTEDELERILHDQENEDGEEEEDEDRDDEEVEDDLNENLSSDVSTQDQIRERIDAQKRADRPIGT